MSIDVCWIEDVQPIWTGDEDQNQSWLSSAVWSFESVNSCQFKGIKGSKKVPEAAPKLTNGFERLTDRDTKRVLVYFTVTSVSKGAEDLSEPPPMF